jgi:hypothetical protein
VEMECTRHIFPRTRTDKTEARRRTCVPPARRREDDIHPGRVTDVVRTSTTAAETERERESRRNRESIQGARPARPLCSTAHPQAKAQRKRSFLSLPARFTDSIDHRSSFERSRHIDPIRRLGAGARLLAQVCASSAPRAIVHPSAGRQWPTSEMRASQPSQVA